MLFIRRMFKISKADFKNQYSSVFYLLFELTGTIVELFIYYFTAKAFVPQNPTLIPDFFTWIVIGEIALLIPLRLMESSTELLRPGSDKALFDQFTLLFKSETLTLMACSLSSCWKDFFRIGVTLLIAVSFFKLHVSITGIAIFLLIQIACAPLYLGLGLLFSSSQILLGRGYGVFRKMIVVFTVFSGAYFPVSVLPEPVQKLSGLILPLNKVVETSREALVMNQINTSSLITIMAVGTFVFMIGIFASRKSFTHALKRGTLTPFIQ